MTDAPVVFDGVWKKFRRGERHDTLRDTLVAALRTPLGARRNPQDLGKDEFWVIRDLSFEVKAGEALGIIGPNGAGKSTTLKLLSRILKPTLGYRRLTGRVGALIEVAAGFHPDLTGRENLYLQGAILGMRRDEVGRKLEEIVEFSGISDFIDTPVKRYSSGMNARLGFAIAAHVDPDVLLIDEVLAVGDIAFQQKCFTRLNEFRRSGAAIVFVSHNMQAIMSLCDRALLLRRGDQALIGDVATVAATYASMDGGGHDPRVTVRRFELVLAKDGASVDDTVAPGTELKLDFEIEARTDLPRCAMTFEVVRTDGVKVFSHTPMVEGAPMLNLSAGDAVQCEVTFSANVLRGTYRIVLSLGDIEHHYKDIEISGLASFVVHETTRNAGIAELAPSYRIHVERTQLTA